MEILFIIAFAVWGAAQETGSTAKDWGRRKTQAGRKRIDDKRASFQPGGKRRSPKGRARVRDLPARGGWALADVFWSFGRAVKDGAKKGAAEGRDRYRRTPELDSDSDQKPDSKPTGPDSKTGPDAPSKSTPADGAPDPKAGPAGSVATPDAGPGAPPPLPKRTRSTVGPSDATAPITTTEPERVAPTVPVRTGDRPKLSVVPETGDQEAPVGSPALAGKTIRQRDAEVHLYADRKGRVSPPLLHADREALKRFAAGEVFEHTMASYTIRSLRNGEYGDPTMESELSRMYAQKRLRENGIKPDAAPANGTPADQATTTQKETTMSDANSIEQVDIKLAAMRAAATQKLEDARADLQRANEDAAGAEQLSGFAARVKAPPQYQAAMNAAAEGPAAAKLAAQQTLSAAEISLANIAKAQVENDKQKTVAEAAAAAGGVMDQSAYA